MSGEVCICRAPARASEGVAAKWPGARTAKRESNRAEQSTTDVADDRGGRAQELIVQGPERPTIVMSKDWDGWKLVVRRPERPRTEAPRDRSIGVRRARVAEHTPESMHTIKQISQQQSTPIRKRASNQSSKQASKELSPTERRKSRGAKASEAPE